MSARRALALAALLAACIPVRRDPVVLSARDVRVERVGAAFRRYARSDQALIRGGRVRVGLDELAVWVALGDPAFHFGTTLAGRPCRAMLYGLADPSTVDAAVYTCDAQVVYMTEVRPHLPCWRVLAAGKRAVEHAGWFDAQPLGRQWDMLAGVLRRRQTVEDVYVAFGRPYNTGTEAREDGTNASVQVFLDHSAQAYGLYVTLVDGAVVAWRFPPDRTLTPEASQHRLDAMEHRLVDQLRDLERTSAAEHREEMALLGEVQTQGDRIREDLANQPERAAQAQRPSAPAPVAATSTGTVEVERNGARQEAVARCASESPCPAGFACLTDGNPDPSGRVTGVCVRQ